VRDSHAIFDLCSPTRRTSILSAQMRSFLSFRLDTANHRLLRGEEPADLTPKAFDVLRYLVEHAGRLVTPDEILETLWPNIYINPEGLRRYIQEIRKVLGDQPDKPVFIKTLLKRGYQFIAPVIEENNRAATGLTFGGGEQDRGPRTGVRQVGFLSQ